MLPKKKGFHRHHIIPKHQGGTDADENIIYLSPEDHAKAHLELYEKYGHYEDAQAYNSLKKYWLESRILDGYVQSEEHIRKRTDSIDYSQISSKLKGRVSPTKGMRFEYKPKPKVGDALRGKARSHETKKKISESLIGKQSPKKIEFYCIFCHKCVPPSKIDRHGIGKKQCL